MIKLTISKEIPSIIIISTFLIVLMVLMTKSVKKMDPYEKPKGLAFLALMFVDTIDNLVGSSMDKESVKSFGPYIGVLASYLFFSNVSGLVGLNPPTASYSITFTLALITWVMIEKTAFKVQGIKGYLKSLIDPIPLFVIPNILGHIAPLISMSFRLFGNILSGGVIMGMVYWATGTLSTLIFRELGHYLNVFGVVLAPALHLYFDLFAGFIQMFVFISLTMVLIQKEK